MKTLASHRLAVLDGWRGLSILCVLATHMLPLGPKVWQLNSMAGPLGMCLFFILSGFLITSNLLEHPQVINFLIRRAARILPLAWLFLGVALPWVQATPDVYFAHVFFYANLPPFWLQPHLTSHFWSLCVEMQFYAGIALLFALLRERGLRLLPLICLGVTVWRIAQREELSIVTYYRVDEILAGACLALVYHQRWGQFWARLLSCVRPGWLLPLLLLACHPEGGAAQYLRPYLAALLVGSTLYQAGGWTGELLRSRVLAYIAQISYALYVIHPLTMQGWLGSGDIAVRYSKRVLSLLLAFGLAHASTFYYEKHWIAWAKRKTRNSRADLQLAITERIP